MLGSTEVSIICGKVTRILLYLQFQLNALTFAKHIVLSHSKDTSTCFSLHKPSSGITKHKE